MFASEIIDLNTKMIYEPAEQSPKTMLSNIYCTYKKKKQSSCDTLTTDFSQRYNFQL